MLTSELASTIKNSSNRTPRKYSLNAFLPLVHSSNPHPLSTSSTSTTASSSHRIDIESQSRKSADIKSRRRVSLSSAIRRRSFAQQSEEFLSTIDTNNIRSSLPNPPNNQPTIIDSDSSERTSSLKSQDTSKTKPPPRKISSNITPIASSLPHRKDYMQKIERFRFIDDSASSTTTVTSPVESLDHLNGHHPCSHLITSAIEQFDDYVRSRYHANDEIDSYIDRLNSDILTNGSYSDLNILNSTPEKSNIPRPQILRQHVAFKPVNHPASHFERVSLGTL